MQRDVALLLKQPAKSRDKMSLPAKPTTFAVLMWFLLPACASIMLLSTTTRLTQDIAPRWRDSYSASKVGTLLVTLFALAIALFADENVFGLVLGAWSSLGATLGPLLILRIAGIVPPPGVAGPLAYGGGSARSIDNPRFGACRDAATHLRRLQRVRDTL